MGETNDRDQVLREIRQRIWEGEERLARQQSVIKQYVVHGKLQRAVQAAEFYLLMQDNQRERRRMEDLWQRQRQDC